MIAGAARFPQPVKPVQVDTNPGDRADGNDGWLLRVNRALMPDYNRMAATYWWAMVALGAAVFAWAGHSVSMLAPAQQLRIGCGVVLAMLAAGFPVRIPRSTNSFAAGEIFIFLLLLLYGPAAASIAAAGEGLVGALRTSKRWTSRIIGPLMACIAMMSVGTLMLPFINSALALGPAGVAVMLIATTACALLHFLVVTSLIVAIRCLKRRQWPVLKEVLVSFGWVGVSFGASGCIACLLCVAFDQTGVGVLFAAVPIITMLLIALYYYFREQAAADLVSRSRVEAAEREAELAAGHIKELRQSEQRFHSAFTHASIGMALVGFDGRLLQVNSALRSLLGFDANEPCGRFAFGDFVCDDDSVNLQGQLKALQARQVEAFEIELRLRGRDGGEVWGALHGSLFAEDFADTPCLILQVQDVTARRIAEANLQHIAFHDSLTGLPNRRRFLEQLSNSLSRANLDKRRHFALMFLDFDRFKTINDSLGHAAGDEFLVAVARRIQLLLRPHDIVARLGGDEFAILVEDFDGPVYAETLAERMIDALSKPLNLNGNEVATSASVGITYSNIGYANPADMLRDADTAMYKAKAAGKGRCVVFDVALHAEVAQRVRLECDLRRALARAELSVAYQPLYDLGSQEIIGFEALARWTHPELGPISPATFIPVAEDSGLILPITDFMLRTACLQLRAWQRSDTRLAALRVHVNLSRSDIASSGLVTRVGAALAASELQAQHLTLELAENILMEHLEAALPALTELRTLGIGLSMDDFGTGCSSLQHLSGLPLDNVKIDRSFVVRLRPNSNEQAVVQAVALIGKLLNKEIVAEGIESAEQLAQLLRLGCRHGQGFYLSQPLSASKVDALLKEILTSGQALARDQHFDADELA
jgi:diguanylate cyclase (GGDEF)-like protein/PAS domain S-box-containing protein